MTPFSLCQSDTRRQHRHQWCFWCRSRDRASTYSCCRCRSFHNCSQSGFLEAYNNSSWLATAAMMLTNVFAEILYLAGEQRFFDFPTCAQFPSWSIAAASGSKATQWNVSAFVFLAGRDSGFASLDQWACRDCSWLHFSKSKVSFRKTIQSLPTAGASVF